MAALWQCRHNLSLSSIYRQSNRGECLPENSDAPPPTTPGFGSGAPGAFRLLWTGTNNNPLPETAAVANRRCPDVKEVVLLEDIYMFLLVPAVGRAIFSQLGGQTRRSGLFIHMRPGVGVDSSALMAWKRAFRNLLYAVNAKRIIQIPVSAGRTCRIVHGPLIRTFAHQQRVCLPMICIREGTFVWWRSHYSFRGHFTFLKYTIKPENHNKGSSWNEGILGILSEKVPCKALHQTTK